MRKNTLFGVLIVSLCVLSLAVIYGCGSNATGGGGGISNRVGSYLYSGTQSPGDTWVWLISTETFSGSNETTGTWVTGTWVTLSSGFGKATIATSGGPDAPAAGEHAYFLEFPNTMLLVKPVNENDSRVMVCAAAATLEPNEGKYLFVNIPKEDWTFADAAFGTVEARNNGSGGWQFDVTSYLITGEWYSHEDPGPAYNFIFTNGVFTDESGSTDTKIFTTPSGVFFGDDGEGDGGFAGGSLEATTLSDVLNHVYKGVRFIYYPGADPTGETEAVTCTKIATMDALEANSYSNIDNNTMMGLGVIVSFDATSQDNGLRRGYVTDLNPLGGTEIIQTVVSKVGPASNRKYMIFGIGLDDRNRSFNFLLIQTD